MSLFRKILAASLFVSTINASDSDWIQDFQRDLTSNKAVLILIEQDLTDDRRLESVKAALADRGRIEQFATAGVGNEHGLKLEALRTKTKLRIFPSLSILAKDLSLIAQVPITNEFKDVDLAGVARKMATTQLEYERLNRQISLIKSGEEKAKAMDQMLRLVDPNILMAHHEAKVSELQSLDSDGKLNLRPYYDGIASRYKQRQRIEDIIFRLAPDLAKAREKKDTAGAIGLIDNAIKQHNLQGEALQLMLMQKFRVYTEVRDYDKIYQTLEEARKVAPESDLGKRIPKIIDDIKAARPKS